MLRPGISRLLLAIPLILGVLLPGSPAVAGVDPVSLVVTTDSGAVRGYVRHRIIEFRGIPYAAPPVGELRFRAPQPPKPWKVTRDATHFGSACPQLHRYGITDESLVEDCLTLNVSVSPPRDAPAADADEKLMPVIVWIHGGAFVGGSSNLYHLETLVKNSLAIIVSINYRVGVFGFMPHAGFDADDNGAYGLEDQRMALAWVQRNIAAFGGDPNNVTVAGESAGAGSICMHLANPEASKGLFAKAMLLSAACMQPLRTVAETEAQVGAKVAAAVGCKDAATAAECLRDAPVEQLLRAGEAVGRTAPLAFAPSVGSKVLPRQPAAVMRAGESLPVPLLVGAARDEMRLYIGYDEQAGRHTTAANYVRRLRDYFGKAAPQVAAEYPLAKDASAPAQLGSVLSDFNPEVPINNCLILDTSATLRRIAPVYEFEFADPNAPVLGVGMPSTPDPGMPLGAVHSAMLSYFFPGFSNSVANDGRYPPFTSQIVGKAMIVALAAFSAGGEPRHLLLPAWPPYTGGATVLRLEPGNYELVDAAAAHRCAFWRRLYPALLADLPPPAS
jgi:para-nitrobenzyl esterase